MGSPTSDPRKFSHKNRSAAGANRINRKKPKNNQAVENQYVAIADVLQGECSVLQPERYQGFVWRKRTRFFNFSHKYLGILTGGLFKLRRADNQKKHKLQSEYVIELDKVLVSYNDKKRCLRLTFQKESHQITPVDRSSYQKWKEAFIRHRQYRQIQMRDVNGSEHRVSRPVVSPTTTLAHNSTAVIDQTIEKQAVLDNELQQVQLLQQMLLLQTKIKQVLLEVKETHADVKNALEADSDDSGSEYDEQEETEDKICAELLPQNSHKSLKETRSQIANIQPINNNNNKTKKTVNDALVQAHSIQQETLMLLIEMKQIYVEIKDRIEESSISEQFENSSNTIPGRQSSEVKKLPAEKMSKSVDLGKEKFQDISTPVVPKINPWNRRKEKEFNRPLTESDDHNSYAKEIEIKGKESEVTFAQSSPAPSFSQSPAVSPKIATQIVHRTSLPSNQIPLQSIPYSAVLRAKLPIWAYEPLGVLQVICEELRFASPLLDLALNASDDLGLRMCYVAAFAMSSYSSLGTRKQKPFNPIRGETFEFVSEDGWNYHAEQITHTPPVSAAHAIHKEWEWSNCAKGDAKITLSGNAELTYRLPIVLKLLKSGEVYNWNKVKTAIINPLKAAEKRLIRNEGTMTIRCSNALECRLLFSNDADNSVTGSVIQNKKIIHRLAGSWDKGLGRVLANGEIEKFFEVPKTPKNILDRFYGFNLFAIALNELHSNQLDQLPPTDSRRRPDQRYLELGEAEKAAKAKEALEKGQRRRESASNHRSMWFEEGTKKDYWITNGFYWISKANHFQDDYSKKMLKDIFSCE